MQVQGNLALGKTGKKKMPVLLDLRARAYLVGGNDAGPRLHQRRLCVAGFLLYRKEVAAFITFEDLCPYHDVLGKPAGDRVAERNAFALVVDIGLDDEA